MKRKRFIKLAMSCGIQRNEAAAMVKGVIVFGSYDSLYKFYGIKFAWSSVKLAFCTTKKAFKKLTLQCKASVAALLGADFSCKPDQTIHFCYEEPLGPSADLVIYDEKAKEGEGYNADSKLHHKG